MKRTYQWFVETWGENKAWTNEIFSRQQSVFFSGEDVLRVIDTDGELHDVWRLPEVEIRSLWKDKARLNINFRIFNRVGSHGPVRDVTFLFEKKSKRR